MMAFTHVVTGLAAWTVTGPYLAHTGGDPYGVTPLVLAALGSLAPDLDHPRSWLGRRLPFISWPLSAVVGHRGVTHSVWAVAAAGYGLYMSWEVQFLWVAAFLVGYMTHLAGDALCNSGIPLFWPHPMRVRPPFAIQTGGVGDFLVGLVASGWIAAWSLAYLRMVGLWS